MCIYIYIVYIICLYIYICMNILYVHVYIYICYVYIYIWCVYIYIYCIYTCIYIYTNTCFYVFVFRSWVLLCRDIHSLKRLIVRHHSASMHICNIHIESHWHDILSNKHVWKSKIMCMSLYIYIYSRILYIYIYILSDTCRYVNV